MAVFDAYVSLLDRLAGWPGFKGVHEFRKREKKCFKAVTDVRFLQV
jgi:hypothetical protein